ncbi:hypothetical protein lacNasYZ03_06300 [Lactobacillus nasalidis]|uniref:Transcriptional regulator DIP2311-like C-terminal domain-containing protein n=1 Tax=Lactobacillus nasalidis TaxID=2797258 RepID=A0ABQ3W4Q9_9LACO|nr:ATP-binding protein [Lactobacillus nasalidis]GHV97292.1 hypothetical protein lacNasYZ01_04740 [Lactobacillus nasalidis]GHV99740.1 hypothetical protein lacNasYZ02_11700 [Lactobacillus nasalidis]GHW00943.1 hypothetical protein lacNasYZ03_06300 [Lactobacillus nasalidis]
MLTPDNSNTFENQLSPRQDLTFNSLKQLFDQQGLAFTPPSTQFGILQFSNFDLLVSDQCPYTIKCAVFKGTDQDEFLDRQEFTGSLASQYQQVYAFLERHDPVESQIKGLYREDRPAYPKQALREALMNAIIHRDYASPSSSLINLYTDRVEFISFGGLMPGITLEDIQLGLSVCRNKRLADLFYQLKLVESYGTGLARIKSAYKGSRLQPQILAAPSSFKVVLPRYEAAPKPAPKPVKKAAVKAPVSKAKPVRQKTGNEEAVLAFAKEHGEFIRSDIEDLLGVSPATATRLLRQMENSGLILKRGKAKAIRYRISEKS